MQRQKNIYMIGIGGAGMSALARLYVATGNNVSGSDDGDGFYHESLINDGITIYTTFDPSHITGNIDAVVYSTAFAKNNREHHRAKVLGLVMQSYPEAVGVMTQEMKTYAVCGTHGKTTTSLLLTHALVGAGRDPSALIGAPVHGWEGGARIGAGNDFVLEADEYQDKLALYYPQSIIVTSIDFDHPDFFVDFESYKKTFCAFISRVPQDGYVVAYGDDDVVSTLMDSVKATVVTYGSAKGVDVMMKSVDILEQGQKIIVLYKDTEYEIVTQLHGRYNALNAVAAFTLTTLLTGNTTGASTGIASCAGALRRFDLHGEYHGAILIDDYAHHPQEVRAILSAVREKYPKRRIVAGFHPHTFTRTRALLTEFAESFDDADHVIVIDIYGSAREEQGGVSSQDLVRAINQICPEKSLYRHTIEDLATYAQDILTDNDIFLTLGAGDIWKVYEYITD